MSQAIQASFNNPYQPGWEDSLLGINGIEEIIRSNKGMQALKAALNKLDSRTKESLDHAIYFIHVTQGKTPDQGFEQANSIDQLQAISNVISFRDQQLQLYHSQYVYGQLQTALNRLDSVEHCLNDAEMQPAAKIAAAFRFLNEAQDYLSKDHERKSDLFLECQQRFERLKEATDILI